MQNLPAQTSADEISLKDVMDFFVRNRWIILGLIVAGLLLAAAYVATTEKSYEARWQLQMAASESVLVETPAILIHRLRVPTAYSVEVRQHCEMPQSGEFGDNLGGKLKTAAVKGINDFIEMKVAGSSPSQAMACAESIVAMITAQQNDLIEYHLANRRQQMAQYQRSLTEEQLQLERIRKSELVNFAYLARLEKTNWLRERIDALQDETRATQPAKLVVPVYAPSKPVSPRVPLALILGGLIGFLAGIMAALFRERLGTRV